ncbi:MAG: hypothetical protein IPK32_07250 [Verrucomicrobiaceae bacterium]|nr:hypothetical protein [Verrucomicrobiaceae bacterium]
MSLVRILLAALLTSAVVSCTSHKADLKFPTVAEADDFDVANGLPRRKTRGGPKQIYKYSASEAAALGSAQGNAPSTPAPASRAAAEISAPTPAPALEPAPQPSVTVPSNLR